MSSEINDLIQTLADGVEGFTKAAESVKDPELKILFEGFAAERQEMADELAAAGGITLEEEKPTVGGTLHRGWINLKGVLTAGDDHAILAECERGEDHAVEVFQNAVETPNSDDVAGTIESIATRILAVHNKVRDLRDAAKAA